MMRKKPMLAYPASDKPIDYTKPVYIQPKLDGVRCLIQYERRTQPREDVVVAYSRTGKEWKNIQHILAELKPFFQKYPNVILDGELYNHDLRDDFETIISLVRRQKPDDIDMLESRDLVQFHCYDCIDIGLVDASFENRMNFITHHLLSSYCVKHVTTDRVYKHEEALDIHHNANLLNGYEGSILRTNDPYACKRSHNLRKFKDFSDTEATIISWVEGKGKRVGTIGKFMAIDADGNEFGMPVMDNFKKLRTMFKEMQTWVGKTATFTYFERTKAGSYRHPLFKAIRDYE
jgi:DNA ligase-1